MLQRGQHAQALPLIASVLARHPDHPAALGLQANAALMAGEANLAVQALQRLVHLQPGQPALRRVLSQALNRKGSGDRHAGREDIAERAFAQALEHWPDNHEALFNLALGYMQSRRAALAIPLWQRLLALAPNDIEAGIELAAALALTGRFDEARARMAAVPLSPDLTSSLRLRRVQIHLLAGDVGTAVGELASVSDSDEDSWPTALAVLAEQFAHAGEANHSRTLYRRAARLRGDGARSPGLSNLIGAHLAIPAIAGSTDDIGQIRQDFASGLDALERHLDDNAIAECEPGLAQLVWGNFFLAYHGQNDLALQSAYGDLLARLAAKMSPAIPLTRTVASDRPRGKARIGLVSSCFRECTAGAYFGRWPLMLAECGYDVHVFQLGPKFDATTDAIGRAPATLHRITGGSDALAIALSQADCDVLIYPELGMDARLLPVAALRLAPYQTCAWGHPVTSGLPTIDAYFSCEEMEPADARAHYQERLLPLPGLGTDYLKPAVPPPLHRVQLGLPESGNLYLLPHSLFKLHPDNDAVFAAIAKADPEGVLVLFEGESAAMRPTFTTRLTAAMRTAGADPDRQMVWLPMTGRDRFLQINQACDVMVDSLHWSGGNTSLDSLISGLPVVTCPGHTMRARQSMAMLRRLGLDELIVDDKAGLVELAVTIARDKARRAELSQRIRAGLPGLFDSRGVREALDGHIRALLEAST